MLYGALCIVSCFHVHSYLCWSLPPSPSPSNQVRGTFLSFPPSPVRAEATYWLLGPRRTPALAFAPRDLYTNSRKKKTDRCLDRSSGIKSKDVI